MGLGTPVWAQSNYATPYTFTVYAGTAGGPGSSDGTGTAASFDQPYGLALDGSGNLYVADRANSTIRKIASGGVVTTLAGIVDSSGTTDATGTLAQFNEAAGIAVGSGGLMYVADTNNDTIRKIASGAVVTTFAGSAGDVGITNDTGTAALFNQPYDIAIDGSGNLYVTDFFNDAIREITPAGVVSTFAGTEGTEGSVDATGTAAEFNLPVGITIDSSGNLYVADSGNNTIRKITSGGVVTTIAGKPGVAGSADGTGSAALFNSPRGVAVDTSGNIYVADSGNCSIRKITSAGVVTTLAGSPGSYASQPGTGAGALFDVPVGIAVDASGNLYVSEELGYTIDIGTVAKLTAPSITQQPASQTVLAGSSVTLSVVAGGVPSPSYQWNLNANPISGATGSSYVIASASSANAGSYTVTLTNSSGSLTSSAATLTVNPNVSSPVFTTQPASQTIASGSTVTFGVVAAGAPAPGYQWYFNGTALANGAGVSDVTGRVLVVGGATSANAGSYYCLASNSSGSAQSSSATLTVVSTANIGRLVDISCRAYAANQSDSLITGFVVGGAGTSGTENVLIRASGPALAAFDITDALPDPQLQLSSGSTLVATNDGWGGSSQISSTAAAVGAFPWTSATSHDAALLETLSQGPYTAIVTGQSGDTGVALAEVYDATPAGSYTPATPRLINISARGPVETGANIMIAGFVIGGTTSRTVLIRASGPALTAFNIEGVLPDPEIQLYSGMTLLATNDGWGGSTFITSAAAAVAAFPWTNLSSADSAILVTLPPGAYTAQVSGASGDSGIALVEVYEVP